MSEAPDHELLAAGEWVASGKWGEVRSPYDDSVVGRVAIGDAATVDRAIAAAHDAYLTADFPQHARAAVLDRAAELAGERIEDLALTIAAEAGKPIKTATVEAERCVATLTFSAVEARKLTGGTVPMEASAAGAGKLRIMLRVPYGVGRRLWRLLRGRIGPVPLPRPVAAYDALLQMTSADLLARATEWAMTEPAAANQIFNVTNGDHIRRRRQWPLPAEALGLPAAAPQAISLARHVGARPEVWQEIVARHGLRQTEVGELLSWDVADFMFGIGWDVHSSTVKIRQAGFAECVDTGAEIERLVALLRARSYIP